jgi:hypothetical protein
MRHNAFYVSDKIAYFGNFDLKVSGRWMNLGPESCLYKTNSVAFSPQADYTD